MPEIRDRTPLDGQTVCHVDRKDNGIVIMTIGTAFCGYLIPQAEIAMSRADSQAFAKRFSDIANGPLDEGVTPEWLKSSGS